MAIISLNLTVFTQPISQDSVKCFTYEQVRIITKDLKKLSLCDSIVVQQSFQIKTAKSLIANSIEQKLLLTDKVGILEHDLKKTNLKLKISKRISTFGLPTFFGVGILVGILLNN